MNFKEKKVYYFAILVFLFCFNLQNVHGDRNYTTEILSNNDFSTQEDWFFLKGAQGDNSTVNANIRGGQANYEILGNKHTFTVVSGIINNSVSSAGWKQFNNSDFMLPDTAELRSYGCFVYHRWQDDENQFPSVHWRKNVSIPLDMSKYEITSLSLEVIFNATVDLGIDTPNDEEPVTGEGWVNYAIGDSVTFYCQISDLGYNSPVYTVASNKTKYLGQNDPPLLNYADSLLKNEGDQDLITALNSAFQKDPTYSNFTITLGIDIYCEDNVGGAENDIFNALIIKSCNLTFTCERKIEKFTSISWNQIGSKISGTNIQITKALLNFQYKIDSLWPSSLSPFSEIRALINNNQHKETLLLSLANNTFQEAKPEGYDVTSLILKNVNISVSIEIFLANVFGLDKNITISIDNVYLKVSYNVIEPGMNLMPLIIGLSVGILGLTIVFTLYQTHFRYPPMVRKVRKLRKKVRKGKKLKPLIFKTHNEIIKSATQDNLQILNLEPEQIKKELINDLKIIKED